MARPPSPFSGTPDRPARSGPVTPTPASQRGLAVSGTASSAPMEGSMNDSTETPPRPRITVIGTGYLGATHAVCMAALGYQVLAVDVDESKVAALAAGRLPFHEPALPELLTEQLASGRLRFTTSIEAAAEFGDVHFVCVGTPQQPGSYAADLRYVDAAVAGLAEHLHRPCLVVGKSTVPVGTADRLATYLAET